jgi:lysophospholipase L1-like esterase
VVVACLAVPGASSAAVGPGAASPSPRSGTEPYYVSLGDSYSVGYQPTPGATAGYTAYVASKEKMTLENFGCGGATTTSILNYTGVCGAGGSYGPPAASHVGPAIADDTQVEEAEAFIAANPGKVGLVTVSIGGNDVTSCSTATNPVACVEAADGTIRTNVTTLVDSLSSSLAAHDDSTTPIVGLTYPDVILGAWVYPTYSPGDTLATESVSAFEDLINPTLKSAYDSVAHGSFVDVTAATGAYTPLTKETPMPKSTGVTDVPQGDKVPVAVVDVCKLTYFCTLGNIHANSKGYKEIGKLIVNDMA